MKDFGEILKYRRIELGLTQEELGAKVGLQKSAIYKYESGINTNPSRLLVYNLAKALDISPAVLMGWEETETKEVKGYKIPVYASVAAGCPLLANDEIIDYEEIPLEWKNQGDFFGLRIKGDSMLPRFVEGDVVIVKKQSTIDSGDLAIILVNSDEATFKKVEKLENGIMLIGFNASVFSPKFYSYEEIEKLPVKIIGKVVELRGKL